MKLDETYSTITTNDDAQAGTCYLHISGDDGSLSIAFPDRTPRVKLVAIADAINAALAAAREIEGAGRD